MAELWTKSLPLKIQIKAKDTLKLFLLSQKALAEVAKLMRYLENFMLFPVSFLTFPEHCLMIN